MLLSVRMEEGPLAKEHRPSLEAGKCKETDFALEPPGKNAALLIL